ncbi:hypothetical protein FACS189490_05830 [Clostridia bacterium]|nr:hypothetical protein FACS189490_05830 [Clostridia bacterium]
MPYVYPFKALRPKSEYAAQVAALPYDVMNAEEAREMVKGNPHSFLHVDKAEIDLPEETDHYGAEVYAKASENLQKLINENVLIKDGKPLFYVYRLTMDGRSQTGLVACVSVEDYLSGKIKKHELTRADKEADRVRHVQTLSAHTGPIFLAHQKDDKIREILSEITEKNAPAYDFTAENGVSHAVWAVYDEFLAEAIAGYYSSLPAFYIADGHHRAAAAVKTAQERNLTDFDEGGRFLSVIFPADELLIMDYNRLVKFPAGLTEAALLERLSESFTIEEADAPVKPESKHVFGIYTGKWRKLTLKAKAIDGVIEDLDVSVLQDYVLSPIFGIDDARTSKSVDFVGGARGLDELSRRVDSGEFDAAFSMFPTSIEELMAVADAGLIMPPKSTWFEPKLLSGLFIHEI